MRKYLQITILIIFMTLGQCVNGQERKDNKLFSVEFADVGMQEVFNVLEKETGIHFYYKKKWLEDKRVNYVASNKKLEEILENILTGTTINYFQYSNAQIVLTENNLIYDELPSTFFGAKRDTIIKESIVRTQRPIYFDQPKQSKNVVETIRIGKENLNQQNENFKISGVVVDENTNQPLQNLTISLNNRSTGTTTDINGYYELMIPLGENFIKYSSIGIESAVKRVIVYSDGTLNVSLRESIEYLDEVVVAADANKNVEEALTGSTSIVVEETKNIPLILGERDVLKVATTLPGITTAGEGAAGFNVRGGSTDQNLILLDHAVIYNPSHFFGIFQAVNPFTTEDVQIYTGGIPAQYGGRLSSVFDITSKNANTEKFSGEAAIGPVTSNVALEIPVIKEKSGLLIGGRSTYSNWILRSLDEESLKNSEASFYDAIAKYNHTINENNTLKATGYYSKDNFSITSDSIFSYNNRLFSIDWEHKFNEKNTAQLTVANSQYQFNIEYDGASNNDFDQGFNINETEYKLRMKYLHSQKHKFDYGIMAKFYRTQPGYLDPLNEDSEVNSININEERALESAIYLSDNYKVSNKFLIDIGLRYSFFAAFGERQERIYEENAPKNDETRSDTVNYEKGEFSKTYGGLEVRLATRYLLKEDLSLKASYNRTYQYIHRLSNNTTISPIDTWKLSDNNIRPQLGNQYSIGLFKNLDANTYEFSLEGYYKTAENILDFKVGSDLLLNQTIETETLQGEGKSYGVEFLARKNYGTLNGWISYTYSRSFLKLDSEFAEERVNGGAFFKTNYDKPHDFSAVLNYKFTKRYSISANFVYQTGRPVTFPIGRYNYNGAEYVYYSDRNAFRIPDYYRLDLGFNIEGNHKLKKIAHSFWNISVYNALGRNNPYSVFFVTENGELKPLQSSIFTIPIPTITYNLKF
ncbi:TonB-dependent receptor [Maribacter sp.]|uniref:TonB-dependent receptor n=1 Tax=Maribacter sp. TaxID=1897614 RepID=UPI0025BF8120|nr:TonB-dependent receptor [Maribacter sp.]